MGIHCNFVPIVGRVGYREVPYELRSYFIPPKAELWAPPSNEPRVAGLSEPTLPTIM